MPRAVCVCTVRSSPKSGCLVKKFLLWLLVNDHVVLNIVDRSYGFAIYRIVLVALPSHAFL